MNLAFRSHKRPAVAYTGFLFLNAHFPRAADGITLVDKPLLSLHRSPSLRARIVLFHAWHTSKVLELLHAY
jgi:hypothetical protein